MLSRTKALFIAILLTQGCESSAPTPASACPQCEPAPQCTTASTATARVVVASASALPIDAPRPQPSAGPRDFLIVEVAANGSCSADGESLASCEDLRAFAKAAVAANPEVRATIRGHHDAPHGKVLHALDILKQHGISRVAFGMARTPPP